MTCRHGHEMTTENTYVRMSGVRVCRKCNAIAQRAFRQRERELDGRLIADLDRMAP